MKSNPLLCILGLVATQGLAAGEIRTNLLFIMADDQGPWAYGASGNGQVPTPNMDRIAREGARFPNAFTPTPVCSPARASILTSRYGSELGITDWINPKVDAGVGLDPELPTWPRLLRQAGYSTALFGKWHVGDLDSQHPTQMGYQTFMGFRGGGTSPKDPVLEKDGVSAKRDGFIVDIVADEAIAWLKMQNPSKPFACSVHFREPHAAYLPVRDEDWATVKDLDPVIPNPDLPGLDVARVKKTMREYLLDQGFSDINSPKAVIKQAYAFGMIQDQQAWLDLQNDRNLTSHVYDEETAKVIFERIENQHLARFDEVLAYMKDE